MGFPWFSCFVIIDFSEPRLISATPVLLQVLDEVWGLEHVVDHEIEQYHTRKAKFILSDSTVCFKELSHVRVLWRVELSQGQSLVSQALLGHVNNLSLSFVQKNMRPEIRPSQSFCGLFDDAIELEIPLSSILSFCFLSRTALSAPKNR